MIDEEKELEVSVGTFRIKINNVDVVIEGYGLHEATKNLVSVSYLNKMGFEYGINADEQTFLVSNDLRYASKKRWNPTNLLDINDRVVLIKRGEVDKNLKVDKTEQQKATGEKVVIDVNTIHVNERKTIYLDLWMNIWDSLRENELYIQHLGDGHKDIKELVAKYPKDSKGMSWTAAQKQAVKDCIPCKFNKFKMGSYKQLPHGTNSRNIGNKIHMDQTSIQFGKKKLKLELLVEDKSKFIIGRVGGSVKEAGKMIESMINEIEILTGNQVKKVYTDKGVENAYLRKNDGIKFKVQFAPTGQSQKNGVVEGAVGKLKQMIPLVSFHVAPEMIEKFSTEIINHAILLQNLQVNSITKTAPNEMMDEKGSVLSEEFSPSQYIKGITMLRDTMPNIPIFAQDCIVAYKKTIRNYKDPGFFVGFAKNENQLMIYSLRTKKIETVSRQAVSFRRSFDFHKNIKKTQAIVNQTLIRKQETDYGDIPKNFGQCKRDPEFYEAMLKEKANFVDNGVYEDFKPEEHRGKEVVNTTSFPLYSRKLNGKAKVRLVHMVKELVGTKSGEATNMVAQQALPWVLSLAARLKIDGFQLSSFDVVGAFLTASINEDPEIDKNKIFVTTTHEMFGPPRRAIIKKAVYGLPNSSYHFEMKLRKVLKAAGFVEISEIIPGAFKSVFYHPKLGLLSTHVDDVLVLSKFPKEVEKMIKKSFEIKWFDVVESFLGAEMEYLEDEYCVNMTKSIEKMVDALPESFQKFVRKPGVPNLKNAVMERLNQFPIEAYKKDKLQKHKDKPDNTFIKQRLKVCKEVPPEYKGMKHKEIDTLMKDFTLLNSQMIFGHLNWIVLNNRWDVVFYLKLLSHFINDQQPNVMIGVLTLVKYLYATRRSKTTYKFCQKPGVRYEMFIDANHEKEMSPNSSYGVVLAINNQVVKVVSDRIKLNLVSSKLPELAGAYFGIKDILGRWDSIIRFEQKLYKDLGKEVTFEVRIRGDNQSVNGILRDERNDFSMNCQPPFTEYVGFMISTMRWMAIKPTILYVKSEKNVADMFTKVINRATRNKLLEMKCMKNSMRIIENLSSELDEISPRDTTVNLVPERRR